ncbi:hypothetical protein LV779_17005 [Streptomyces thinghirensis]|nr:hypothetical protein [Streptomyces thinghirensis]
MSPTVSASPTRCSRRPCAVPTSWAGSTRPGTCGLRRDLLRTSRCLGVVPAGLRGRRQRCAVHGGPLSGPGRRTSVGGRGAGEPGRAGYSPPHDEARTVAGTLTGTTGVLAMTLGEKAEQRLTGRPDSHVPARTLERLTGMREHSGRQPVPGEPGHARGAGRPPSGSCGR